MAAKKKFKASIKEVTKSRYLMIEIYPEHFTQNEIERIMFSNYPNADFAYILHDSDRNDDGTLKKAHYHLAIKNPSVLSLKTLASYFPQDSSDDRRFVVAWDNYVLMFRYLAHLDDDDKFQYSSNLIYSNFDIDSYLCQMHPQGSELEQLFDYCRDCHPTLKQLTEFAFRYGLHSTYKQYYNILKDYIYEKY